jgi:hypothetical protein
MEKHDLASSKRAGFKNDRRKRNEEQLRLELEVAMGWAPGPKHETAAAVSDECG